MQDAVIPRTKLPETLRKITEIGKRYGFTIGNIFHAGDGNLHPIILFDQRDSEEFKRAVAASGEIMRHCIECGGALSGEHGIGMEKNELMSLMFSDADLELMRRTRETFNPGGHLNPGTSFDNRKRMQGSANSEWRRGGVGSFVKFTEIIR